MTLERGRAGVRMIVAFAEDLAAKSFLGRSWKAEALRIWGVEILVIELHGDVRTGIRDAQSASSDSAHTWLHAPVAPCQDTTRAID